MGTRTKTDKLIIVLIILGAVATNIAIWGVVLYGAVKIFCWASGVCK